MASIKCPGCGAVNQDSAPTDSCWKCGTPLGAAPQETTHAEPEPSEKQKSSPLQLSGSVLQDRQVRKQNWLPLIATFLMLLILIILAVILLHR
ncbi:MAG TPA: hypothetical protein VGS41_12925 [Chthonomonadales bacterium]|nr:hypothetical protein [Chthonomonadales bacterium]